MKKRLALAAMVLALVVCIIAICIRPSRITYEAYLQIQVGMTRDQVEEILGGPPRKEVKLKGRADWLMSGTRSGGLALARRPDEWWGVEGRVLVYFDAQGSVIWALFSKHPSEMEAETFWDQARGWSPW